jgi:hypothetical protein
MNFSNLKIDFLGLITVAVFMGYLSLGFIA